MNIKVEHFDGVKTHNISYTLSVLNLIKHLGMAGQGYKFSLRGLRIALGMYLLYTDFLDPKSLSNNHFGRPSDAYYDQNLINNFSTIVGKGMADFLAKKIYSAKYTFSYEAKMKEQGHPIKKSRPDLLCFSKNKQFAIEAKGRTKKNISQDIIDKFKKQSGNGPINVHFSVASVTYNLYDRVKCIFNDPVNEDADFNGELLNNFAQEYYAGFFELKDKLNSTKVVIEGTKYYQFYFGTMYGNWNYTNIYTIYPSRHYSQLRNLALLVDAKILDSTNLDYAETEFFQLSTDNIYIDSDGIGISTEYHS